MDTFDLPPAISTLFDARNAVRNHYEKILRRQGSQVALKFTFDSNLIGDIGEAIAAELYGVELVEARSTEGIDGYAVDGRSVQIKATGTGRGAVFRKTETRAEHLLFFCLDFKSATGTIVYNGPEDRITQFLSQDQKGQRMVSRRKIESANALVAAEARLPRIG